MCIRNPNDCWGCFYSVGIGLSILYQIVEAYRCRIDVSSELGVGTRFDLYIPFADRETTTPQLEL